MNRLLNKRERIILYITVIVVVFSVGFNFLIAPVLKKYELLNQEIKITRSKFKKYLRLLKQKDYIHSELNKFSSGVNFSNATNDALVSTLSELEGLAKSANIRIVDIRPKGEPATASRKEVIIDIRAEGDIEGYSKFMYNIENSLYLLRIKRFQLNAKLDSPFLEGIFSISKVD